MASTETLETTMDMSHMTVAVHGLVNLFLNMDGKSREMFIKLLVVKMQEEEVDLIIEVVDMRNTRNTGFNVINVKEDDVKIDTKHRNTSVNVPNVKEDYVKIDTNNSNTSFKVINDKEEYVKIDTNNSNTDFNVLNVKKTYVKIETNVSNTGFNDKDSNNDHNYKTETSNDKNTVDKKINFYNDDSICKLREESELECTMGRQDEIVKLVKMVKCEVCSKKFGSKKNLKMHIYRTHTKGKYLKCDQCSYETSDHTSMNNHKRIHTGERPFVCHMCSKTFSRNSHMNRHIKQCQLKAINRRNIGKHESLKYVCEECDYKATTKGNLTKHVAVHEGIRFVCEECDFKATSKQKLKNHKESVHLGIRHECSQCDHKATSKGNLIQHISYVHESIQHDCKVCDYTTFKKGSFHKHMTRHRKAQEL